MLDDPSAAWVVESGSVGLFRVALSDGEPAGRRRFFFSCGPGEAFYGVPAGAGEPALVAVALEEATLGVAAAEGAPVARWIERWDDCLGRLEFDGREDLDRMLGGGGSEGAGAGLDDLVAAFHRDLVERIRELETEEEREAEARFVERERRSKEVALEAVGRLASVLEPAEGPPPHGSDLFVAASAVGQALGIAMRPPASWEEGAGLIEPVEMIARASHVRVRKVQLSDVWWTEDCGPLLAFEREGRKPVALLPRGPDHYVLFDPETRTEREVDEEAASALDPEASMFYRRLPEQATRGIELIRFALKGRSRDLLTILAVASAATLLGMFTPQATALLVDRAIPDASYTLLWQIGLGLLAAALGAAIFRFSQGVAMMRVETAADAATQSAVWDRLLNLQLSFFRKFSTGDLQSRVTAISQIRSYLSGTTLRTLFSSVILLLNFGLLLYYSRLLTLVAIGVAAASGAVTILSGVMILRCVRPILELRGRFFGLMVQLINGVAKLRVAAAEERAFAKWASEYSELLRLELRQRKIQDVVQVINVGLSTLSAIVLFAMAARLVLAPDGAPALTTGVFLAFNVAYGTFIGAIVNLSNTVTNVMAIAILRERARPILEAAPEVNESKTDPGRLEGRLALDHVVFQYRSDGPIILDDVSVRAEPGQFVALVGPSGSGKSTVLRLLLGLESPQSGSIFYDGQDLSGLDVYAIRRQMGVVLQNGQINAGSLFDNIASGTRVSLNDAWEAAAASGFADDIKAMPMGMHTVISEGGTNLSGGQRQRLLLTRSLVHRPRILFLDEATSALDNKTQAIVSQSLQDLQVTRIVIAHRLSTIRSADQIYVIDGGRVVQQGGFDVLAAQEGLFARLMARQMA